MSHSNTNSSTPQRVVSVNWSLLGRRLRLRVTQLFTAVRHRAAHTQIDPPPWAQRLRLSWFRLGLLAIALFVYTQKQVDFTITIGDKSADLARHGPDEEVQALSILPTTGSAASTASAPTAPTYGSADVETYVARFARVARAEENRFAIPAPAKMAMAILESQAGTDRAAREANNHFPYMRSAGTYDNAWASWRAHSEHIDRRFPQLAREGVNYQQWIAALATTDYSTDAHYGKKLLDIIEQYELAGL